jgi:hypothetical protein
MKPARKARHLLGITNICDDRAIRNEDAHKK